MDAMAGAIVTHRAGSAEGEIEGRMNASSRLHSPPDDGGRGRRGSARSKHSVNASGLGDLCDQPGPNGEHEGDTPKPERDADQRLAQAPDGRSSQESRVDEAAEEELPPVGNGAPIFDPQELGR